MENLTKKLVVVLLTSNKDLEDNTQSIEILTGLPFLEDISITYAKQIGLKESIPTLVLLECINPNEDSVEKFELTIISEVESSKVEILSGILPDYDICPQGLVMPIGYHISIS